MSKLSKLIEEFLRYLLIDKGYSENTIESYKRDLDKFLEYNKNTSIDNISNEDLKKYIRYFLFLTYYFYIHIYIFLNIL